MYVQYPYYYNGKYYAKIDDKMVEIPRDVAYAMNSAYRTSRPKKIDYQSANGEIIEKRLREIPVEADDLEVFDHLLEADMGFHYSPIEALVLLREKDAALHQSINKLDDEEKAIIQEIYFNDMTQRDLGQLLGISASTVNRRLREILEKMKKMLENQENRETN